MLIILLAGILKMSKILALTLRREPCLFKHLQSTLTSKPKRKCQYNFHEGKRKKIQKLI